MNRKMSTSFNLPQPKSWVKNDQEQKAKKQIYQKVWMHCISSKNVIEHITSDGQPKLQVSWSIYSYI